MTDKEYSEFMVKSRNIPYKDYTWLKDHCYRTLKKPCSPRAVSEHLAILDLIKEHEERNYVIDKIRAEIEQMDFDFGDYYDHTDEIIEKVCKAIDKYKAESEG